MRRRVAAPFLFLLLACAPAWAGDKLTLHVSATILPRNTCALDTQALMRCSGTDAKVLYRTSSNNASLQPLVASAMRGKAQQVRTPAGRDILTIEF
jgi:hypothetical protein